MASYEVREALDVYAPRRAVQELGASLGFSRSQCHELAIVVSELVSNIVKYGVSGSVRFEEVWDPRRGRGVSIVAEDIGLPFHDAEMATRDGYDDRGPIDPAQLLRRKGLGTGLGAIIRLTDDFQIEHFPGGKRVCAVRYAGRAGGANAKK